jgi:hypothetical protein
MFAVNHRNKDTGRARLRRATAGQALLLVVVMMGGVIFLVTAVAGLLMYYQVEQSNDTANSTVAIFAADAGLEKALYYYFYEFPPSPCTDQAYCTHVVPAVAFENGASAEAQIAIPQDITQEIVISANGVDTGRRTTRALETYLLIEP